MTALVAELVPSGRGDEKPAKVGYQPKAKDWLFLEAVQQVVADTGRLTNAAIASHLNCTEEAVRKRLRGNAAFRAWVNEQLEVAVAEAWPKVMARATNLAMRGSIDHMNFLAKVGGKFAQPEGGAGQGGNLGPTFIFNSLVPRR